MSERGATATGAASLPGRESRGERPRRSGPRRSRPRLRLHPAGLVLGTAWAMLAMTPSLVPRDWVFQGIVSGISAAAGYGAGVALAWLACRSARWRRAADLVRRRAPGWTPRAARAVLLVAGPVALVTMLVVAASWQREVAALTGMAQPTTSGWLRAAPLLVAVAAALLAAARGLRRLARSLSRALGRWARLPRRLARVGGAVLAAALVVTVVDDVVLRRALSAADSAFSALDAGTYRGVVQPQGTTRSGSPASLVPWTTLGREGRSFVAGGPPPQELAQVAGRTPLEPVRAYVGLASAPTPQARADLAVAELERAGAFERAVLAVVTTTGTGWVNARAPDSLELMHGGDTAIVATQYSYLPSWLSFVLDRSRAQEAGRLLWDAVHARVDQLPEGDRPRLLAYGESLGSQGSEAAFTTLADIRAQADGVLWVGPPHSNELWHGLVQRRDPGTPAVEPVYASGLVVRFASDPPDLAQPPEPWLEPRVLYLQHPSDPIVWWSPELLFRRPDWLVEPPGDDVSPAMSWYPVVTFWQVTADLTHSQSVPDGHGHNYNDLIVHGWAAVAAPAGWTAADTEHVRRLLAS